MKLHYYKDGHGNFGDDLNPWLWPRLLPDLFDGDGSEIFVGIGTILDQNLPRAARKVVLGAGCGYNVRPDVPLDDTWRVYCVRGPRTAAALQLPAATAVIDPGILMRRYFTAAPRRERAALMLHHRNPVFDDWRQLCANEGIDFIDPHESVEQVMEGLGRARVVLAEAMHGAIIADALRVPWVPLKLWGGVLEWKWRDWTESLGVPYEPDASLHTIHPVSPGAQALVTRAKTAVKHVLNGRALRRLAAHPGYLSDDRALDDKEARLLMLVEQLRADRQNGAVC